MRWKGGTGVSLGHTEANTVSIGYLGEGTNVVGSKSFLHFICSPMFQSLACGSGYGSQLEQDQVLPYSSAKL